MNIHEKINIRSFFSSIAGKRLLVPYGKKHWFPGVDKPYFSYHLTKKFLFKSKF